MVTRSTSVCGVSMETHGCILACKWNVFLSSRFTEEFPAAMGVFRGPAGHKTLSTTRPCDHVTT